MAGKNSHSKIRFLADNKQVVYSILLMIVIPGAVVFNTWFLSGYFRDAIDRSIQDKAISIGQSINAGLADKLSSSEEMQSFVDDWQKYNEDAKMLDILYPGQDSFKLAASMDKAQVGKEIGVKDGAMAYVIAWNNDYPTTQRVLDNKGGSNNPYWLVMMPLKDLQGNKQALLAMEVSTDAVSSILMSALSRSYLILMLTVLLIVLLLFVNSHLFEYSILYNKIKEIDAMKDDFISIASHELRTPVVIIKGFISLAAEELEKVSGAEKVKEYMSIVGVSADRLSLLIDDLLNVSRIEQGRLKVDLQKMDALPIIEETVKEFKVQADGKKLSLVYASDPGTKFNVAIDKDRFKQIMINIVGNAVKYTPAGSIEIRAKNKGKSLILTIKDTGLGMSAKEREHLFEKFYRIKKKETEEIIGTGLGLWITKQLIVIMNGSISVDSIENVGSQFTIELPLAE
ncbi:MAG: HAMP domain-containing sensor histidine kinase [Candidatus Paceibacterota bacterium]|jgi:signal transduction histidine kinase